MARRDYTDDEDFYSQGFDEKDVVSVWLGLKARTEDENIDTLQDLCGVGYYRLSDQESNSFNDEEADISSLLLDISYSPSFAKEAITAARAISIERARRIVVQYDFAYNPQAVKRATQDDPIFLGVFQYVK